MINVEQLTQLAAAGVSAERLNALVDAELEAAKNPKPEDKKDPDKKDPDKEDPDKKDPDKKDPDKKDPDKEDPDKKDPDEPDQKDKEINDLKEKVKKLQEENRRKSGSADATDVFQKACDDLISKISSEL